MDPTRTPVIAAVGQVVEREEIVDAVELASRAAIVALDTAKGLRDRIQRLTMVSVVFSPVSLNPASQVAERLGLTDVEVEVSTHGGNLPQWLVSRAARDIAAGSLDTTLITGAEATRSARATAPDAKLATRPEPLPGDNVADPIVGSDMSGVVSAAEIAARLVKPTEVYALFESARAHSVGRSFEEQRAFLAPLMSRFSQVAAAHPYAWFSQDYTPEEICQVTPQNRLVCEPYTKRMNAFPNVDQGCAIIVTSLARARELGLADRSLFVWSGANNTETAPATRRDLGDAPAMRAASAAALASAGVGADDLDLIDLYSCFPIAVEVGAAALGVSLDDPRGLTLTGGLPFFGGPGNNYSAHAIATLFEKLPERGGLGYIGANGGFLSKHSMGVYGCEPPPEGFRLADTSAQQARIDADALAVAAEAEGEASVVAATVVYGRDGRVEAAPLVASLGDGTRVIAQAEGRLLGDLAGTNLVGERVRVSGSPLTYDIIR